MDRLGSRTTREWQERAWTYYDEVPELGYAVDFLADSMSKVELYPFVMMPGGSRVPVSAIIEARLVPEGDRGPDQQLHAAVDVPDAVLVAAVAEVAALRAPYGGQAEFLRRLEQNIELTGELYVVGREVDDPETGTVVQWDVRSVSEVRKKDDGVYVYEGPEDSEGLRLDPDRSTVIRIWIRHPRWGSEAYSPMKRLLGECETLRLLGGQKRAESRSRHMAGLLLLPNELDGGPPDPVAGEDGEEAVEDPLFASLEEALLEPVIDPDSSGTVLPTALRGPMEALREVRHITLDRSGDGSLETKIEKSVERLARGINLPVEVVMGHMETTYANAEQVDENIFDDHLEPRCELVCDALTQGFLLPQLTLVPGAGSYLGRLGVWYDATRLRRQADPEAHASEAHDRFVISDEAYRRILGFRETDAPTPVETLIRAGLKKGILTADLTKPLLELLGVPILVEALPTADQGALPAAPDQQALAILALMAAASRGHDDTPAHIDPERVIVASAVVAPSTGRRLMDLDRDLRTRLVAATDARMARALERATNRLRGNAGLRKMLRSIEDRTGHLVAHDDTATTLGQAAITAAGMSADDLIPDDAFDALAEQFTSWVTATGRSALDLVEEVTGGITVAERTALDVRRLEDATEAWAWLRARLLSGARAALFHGQPIVTEGEFDPTLRVGVSWIRQALALAGGARVETMGTDAFVVVGNRPPTGVATGPLTMGVLEARGMAVDGYRWDYGPAARATPFHPHMRLDGRTFRTFDDAVLANSSGFPPFGHFFPGDHRGCVCDAEPIILTTQEA